MGAPTCAVLSLTDWCPKKIKTKNGSLKSKQSTDVHNENSNIQKADRVNCNNWEAETATPSAF